MRRLCLICGVVVLLSLTTVCGMRQSVAAQAAPPGSLDDVSPCGVAPKTGQQDVQFTATISYGGSQDVTQSFITTLIVTNATGVVASQTHVINLTQETGGVKVPDPQFTVKGMKPGTYTVQAMLVHQPITPPGPATVLGQKACTFTIDPPR
jgi:hypothetical protein